MDARQNDIEVEPSVNNPEMNHADVEMEDQTLQSADSDCEDASCLSVEGESALNGTIMKKRFTPKPSLNSDIWSFLHENKDTFHDFIKFEIEKRRSLKYFLCLKVILKKTTVTPEGVTFKTDIVHRQSKCRELLIIEDLDEQLESVFEELITKIIIFQSNGSGWMLQEIIFLDISVATYKAIKGSNYINTPRSISNKKVTINVRNSDNKCFLWSVLACLFPASNHPSRISNYKRYEQNLNMSGIKYPVTLQQIPKFEKQNSISICVFGYENKTVYPLYVSDNRGFEKHVNLLLLHENGKNHYIAIKNLDGLLFQYHSSRRKRFYCYFCLRCCDSKNTLDKHIS